MTTIKYKNAEYTNIDNISSKPTRWPNVYLGSEQYVDITKITAEIPIVLQSSTLPMTTTEMNNYWQSEPRYMTKLMTYNTFRTRYVPMTGSLKVMCNGKELPSEKITYVDNITFTIDKTITDGFLWVSYYPTFPASSYPFGNIVAELQASGKILADHKVPMFSTSLLIRCRKVINNIEGYYAISPTMWVGGFNNETISTHSNIIPSITPLCSDHITELQYAIKRIISYMENFIPSIDSVTTFSKITFTSVTESSVLSTDIFNEITYALTKIEAEIVTMYLASEES